mgnify:CR=1 FL=1
MASEMQGKLIITADTVQGVKGVDALTSSLGRTQQAATATTAGAAQTATALDKTATAAATAAKATQTNSQSLQANAAAQADAGKAADALGAKMAAQGKAAGVSIGQTTAAMRQLPAQLTDVVTQLQGGANPFTVLIQQGGQVKDSFGGIRPALSALGSLITPTAIGVGLLATSVAALAGGALLGSMESASLTKALALNGNQAGLTLGQINTLSQGLVAAKGVTIGTARDITAALVDTGRFGGVALDSIAGAAASFSRVSKQSADEIVKDFAGIADGASAWAVKANQSYNFLTAAQVAQIRELESQGRTAEAVKLTMDALAGTMDQRLTPAIGTMERGWQAAKVAVSELWDGLKDIGRDDTAEQALAKLEARVASLQGQAQRFGGAGGGLLDRFFAGQAGSAAAEAQAELAAARQSKNTADLRRAEKAIADKAEQTAIEQGSRTFVDALLAVERAGDAKRLASLQAGIAGREQAAAQGYRTGVTSAAQYADELLAIQVAKSAADAAQIQQQIAIERKRVTSNPLEVKAKEAAIATLEAQAITQRTQAAQAARELQRSLAASQDGADLARQQAQGDASLRLLDASLSQLEQRERAGLVTAAQVAQARLVIEQAKLTEQGRLIDEQIAQQQRLQLSGAAAIDRDARITGLKSQRAGVDSKIAAIPGAATAAETAQALVDARAAAAEWAQLWQSAADNSLQLSDQTAQSLASLITDPLERARVEADLSVVQIQRAADKLRLALGNKIDITRGQASQAAAAGDNDRASQLLAQAAELEAQRDSVNASTNAAIVARNAQLADAMKPGWQKLVDGWSDTNRLMRESSDQMMEHLVKGGEDAFVQLARTGKLNLKDLGSTLLDDTLRTSYRKLISGDGGKSGLDIASKIFGGMGASQGGGKGSKTDTFNAWEQDLADMSDSAKTAGNSLQQSAAAGDGLAGMLGAVGGGLGAFANFVQMAAQAVMSLAATAGSSSGGGLAGALAGLFGGANGKAGGGDAAGAGSAAAARGATFAGGVAMFARGGAFTNQVVSRPTPFRFRNGGSLQQGLMGEAGPEAVMPLQNQGGGLGVAALDSRGRQIGVMALARGPGGRLGAVVADQGAGSTRARFAAGGWFGAGAGTWASPARFAAGAAFDAGVGTRMAQAMAPAAVATGTDAGVALHLTVAPVISIDGRADKTQVIELVQQGMAAAVDQAQARILDMMRRNRAAFRN